MNPAMTAWTAADIPDQRGRIALVTGANSGLGLRSAEALARAGATVLMACRDQTKGKVALDVVRESAAAADPELVELDLSELDSVRAAADAVRRRTDRVDVLMNNAGVMAIPLRRTTAGHEMQFATNHLGHFALTGLLLPLLTRAGGSARVVTTSSMAHRVGSIRFDDPNWEHGYRKWLAYGQSKLANLLFTAELDRRAGAAGTQLVAVAAHPGYASTHLQAAGPEMVGNSLAKTGMNVLNAVMGQSDAAGALPQLYGATAPAVEGGQYFGPRFLGWRGLPTLAHSSGRSRKHDDARRLWEMSEELTGVRYRFT
jgi:NAD(P)-dependent dehydrogenase (short-subunit alcohol dehydrogenase family)